MNSPQRDDPVWQQAWRWMEREHEEGLTAEQRAELSAWLRADPSHQRQYAAAAQLWVAASLVPAVHVPADPAAPLDTEALKKLFDGKDGTDGN